MEDRALDGDSKMAPDGMWASVKSLLEAKEASAKNKDMMFISGCF